MSDRTRGVFDNACRAKVCGGFAKTTCTNKELKRGSESERSRRALARRKTALEVGYHAGTARISSHCRTGRFFLSAASSAAWQQRK
ncbi:hypothetical protein C9E91_10095 [Rhizobium sp. SEMIA4064]|nr:hypothetical protein C9E91_10095 [Rhizobium sp. SEMIA4064]